jgi:hypothetical protein
MMRESTCIDHVVQTNIVYDKYGIGIDKDNLGGFPLPSQVATEGELFVSPSRTLG